MRKIRTNRTNLREELLIVYDMLVRGEEVEALEHLMTLLFSRREGFRRVLGRDRG